MLKIIQINLQNSEAAMRSIKWLIKADGLATELIKDPWLANDGKTAGHANVEGKLIYHMPFGKSRRSIFTKFDIQTLSSND